MTTTRRESPSPPRVPSPWPREPAPTTRWKLATPSLPGTWCISAHQSPAVPRSRWPTPTGRWPEAQNTLTFTSEQLERTAQTVTVNAGEDDDAVNDAASIAHAVVDGSSADEYDPVANVDLAVTVTDDDTAGITVSVTQLTVTEAAGTGRAATYTVKLNSQPTGNVTITPSSSDGKRGHRVRGPDLHHGQLERGPDGDGDRRRRRRGPGGYRPHRHRQPHGIRRGLR